MAANKYYECICICMYLKTCPLWVQPSYGPFPRSKDWVYGLVALYKVSKACISLEFVGWIFSLSAVCIVQQFSSSYLSGYNIQVGSYLGVCIKKADFYRFCFWIKILRVVCVFVKLPASLWAKVFTRTVHWATYTLILDSTTWFL